MVAGHEFEGRFPFCIVTAGELDDFIVDVPLAGAGDYFL